MGRCAAAPRRIAKLPQAFSSEPDEGYWAVAQVIPHKEKLAAAKLDELGFKTVLPILQEKTTIGGRRITREHLPYHNYLFIYIVDSWISALGLEREPEMFEVSVPPGGFQPQPARRSIMAPETHVLRVLLDEQPLKGEGAPRPARVRPADYVDNLILEMKEYGGFLKPVSRSKFLSGQRVHVGNFGAPFFGLYGTYEGRPGNQLARVLFDMLGRKVPTILNEGDLVAA
jgi:hypothetical protein